MSGYKYVEANAGDGDCSDFDAELSVVEAARDDACDEQVHVRRRSDAERALRMHRGVQRHDIDATAGELEHYGQTMPWPWVKLPSKRMSRMWVSTCARSTMQSRFSAPMAPSIATTPMARFRRMRTSDVGSEDTPFVTGRGTHQRAERTMGASCCVCRPPTSAPELQCGPG